MRGRSAPQIFTYALHRISDPAPCGYAALEPDVTVFPTQSRFFGGIQRDIEFSSDGSKRGRLSSLSSRGGLLGARLFLSLSLLPRCEAPPLRAYPPSLWPTTSYRPWPLQGTSALTLCPAGADRGDLRRTGRRLRVPRLIGTPQSALCSRSPLQHWRASGLVPIEPDSGDLVLGISAAIILIRSRPAASPVGAPVCAAIQLDPDERYRAGLTFLLVYLVAPGQPVVACRGADCAISVATSPGLRYAVVTRVTRARSDHRAHLAATAMNSIYAVLLTTAMLAWVHVDAHLDAFAGATLAGGWLPTLYLVFGSLALAAAGGQVALRALALVAR